MGTAVPLFVLGGFFAYLAMSRGLRFLLGPHPQGGAAAYHHRHLLRLRDGDAVDLRLAFELPLVLVMLNLAGVVSHTFIRKYRRVMIFLVFVFAGAATPSPDPFSMLLLAIPCVDPGGASRVVRLAERPPPGAP